MWKKLAPAVDKHQNQWELYKIHVQLDNMNINFLEHASNQNVWSLKYGLAACCLSVAPVGTCQTHINSDTPRANSHEDKPQM